MRDAYHLLMELGYPVRPAGDEKNLEPGITNTMMKLVIFWMSRIRLGALCTTEHCRHAPQEMADPTLISTISGKTPHPRFFFLPGAQIPAG